MEPSFVTLFLLSFLAATLLPIGSEWYLVLLVHRGFDLPAIVFVASCGNYLGACTSYLVGVWGAPFIINRLFRLKQKDLERAKSLYTRFGAWSLLLSWLPVVGDPLCVVGGIFRIGFFRYSILVLSGKFTRYLVVALMVKQLIT